MPDLAIVIVSWNVCQRLHDCLASVFAELTASQINGVVWVVDNASHDNSVEMVQQHFPQVELIASAENLGFAGGNNAALRAIGFPDADTYPFAVLLLNPDTIVQPGALTALLHTLKTQPNAGIAGANLTYGDGSFQHGAFDFPGLWQLAIDLLPVPGRLVESRRNGRYPQTLYEQPEPFKVGHPLGAAMGVRGEAIAQVGLLDEGYHMYVEEVDWAWRIRAAGWTAYCVPTAHVTHFGGQSTGQVKRESTLNLWQSRYRFYRTYYHPLTVWLATQIVRLGCWHKLRQESHLPADERAARREIYQEVINIWSEP